MPRKPSKTVLPAPLPKGEILTDLTKKKWCLGPSIGKGGFGEIYSAAEFEGNKKNLNYQYVVKIEPHGNGPLFCEMHFFMRNAKPDMIKNWCSEKKISVLGIPRYLGSGSHEHGGNKFRFLVMDKYGKDLWNIFLENKKVFPIHTVFRLGIQLIDSLEYIHSNGYCHADLKGANILLGLTKQTQNQAFLVDFGLASKYTQKEFKPDPKKAHNGTIEYTSRDAHDGVPTRRSDIEILAYNLVQWMGCILPWEKNLKDPVVVQKSKIKYMDDITAFMSYCFGKNKAPAALIEFLNYVAKMSYDTEPDYKKLRTILTKGLKASGGSASGPFDFKPSIKHKNEDISDTETPEKKSKLTPVRRTPRKTNTPKKVTTVEDDSEDEYYTPEVKVSKGRGRSSKNNTDEVDKKLKVRSKKFESISDSDSEHEIEKPSRSKKIKNGVSEDVVNVSENTNGFNAEMLRLQKKIAERNATKTKRNRVVMKSNGSTSSGISTPIDDDDVIEATPPEKINSVRRKVHTPGERGEFVNITPRGRRLRH